MGVDLLFCQIVEAEYNATVNTIEAAIGVPQLALRALKGYIKRFEAVTIAFVEGRLDVIEALVNQLWNLLMNEVPFDRFDAKNICELAYTCLALRRHFFPADDDTGASDASYVQFIPLSTRNALRDFTDTTTYQNFDTYVCKLGFRRTLRGFVNAMLAEIQTELDELLARLGTNKIDEWIHDYRTASLPFLRLMNELDKFVQCAFATCNFAQTAINKREDISDRLLYERQGTGWSVKADDFLLSVRKKESKVRSRIDALRTRLANPKFDSQGVKASDILKF